ncbi:hypothetical protein H2198_010165 [Neophaeococcomyces mojaviensis]|uniref:Uncharacterized protein n=1 Tax=Neophaeococcomyces mojaviensis TaxID=3383035 RepID=A0ACC2ZSI2_9EURO|nr:hypothetical protein H2198_010165 [Knufia sp. JES_112]
MVKTRSQTSPSSLHKRPTSEKPASSLLKQNGGTDPSLLPVPSRRTECPECRQPIYVTKPEDTASRSSLGTPNTSPSSWRRGQIIRLPHLLSPLHQLSNPDYHAYSGNAENTYSNTHHAIIVAVYATNLITLPIFTNTNGPDLKHQPNDSKLVTMHILPTADEIAEMKVTDNNLYIAGPWRPDRGSHIHLLTPLAVPYTWPLQRTDQLDGRSGAILQQRWRIAHNMSFIPADLQESYFRSQITREPVLAPLPDGSPAEEFYMTYCSAGTRRASIASENENLLKDDMGMRMNPGRHDRVADNMLLAWKPSLAVLLLDGSASVATWEYTPISPQFHTGLSPWWSESSRSSGLSEPSSGLGTTTLKTPPQQQNGSSPEKKVRKPDASPTITKNKEGSTRRRAARGKPDRGVKIKASRVKAPMKAQARSAKDQVAGDPSKASNKDGVHKGRK